MKTTTVESTCQQLIARGWAIESTSPIAKVEGEWPCLSYQCRLTLNGREVWAGEFKMGVGHVKLPTKTNKSAHLQMALYRMPAELESALYTKWSRLAGIRQRVLRGEPFPIPQIPGVKFKDQMIEARLAQHFALRQKVSPKLSGVLHSVLSDSSDTDSTFEDWAAGLGYDPDSIKARGIYDACQEIARTLRRNLPKGERTAVEEILSDY